jgi:hypothetical protein
MMVIDTVCKGLRQLEVLTGTSIFTAGPLKLAFSASPMIPEEGGCSLPQMIDMCSTAGSQGSAYRALCEEVRGFSGDGSRRDLVMSMEAIHAAYEGLGGDSAHLDRARECGVHKRCSE